MKLTKTDKGAFVRAVMQEVPKIDYDEAIRKRLLEEEIKQAPPKLAAILMDNSMRGLLKQEYCGYRAQYAGWYITWPEFKLSPELRAELDQLISLKTKQNTTRYELEKSVGALIESCSTLKQARERLPEFVKYLPADRATTGATNLPAPLVADTVVELVKNGWPAGAKKK